MGYRATVSAQVARAFRMVGDLADDVTLRSSTASGYDFSTRTPSVTGPVSKTVRAILVQDKAPARPSSTLNRTVLLRAEDVPTPDVYDEVVIDGVAWRIVPPYEADRFLITLRLARQT